MQHHWKGDFLEYLQKKTIHDGNCLIWIGCKTYGYGTSTVKGLVKRYNTSRVHRMVYMYYNQILLKPEECVLHACDNPPCVNIKHLRLGTQWENMQDMVKKGRQGDKAGENHGKAKLTWEKVEFIRRTKGIFSGNLIAQVFGLDRSTINQVRRNETWEKTTGVN